MNMRRYKIADIGTDFGDAPFGSSLKSKDYAGSGIPIVQGRNIVNQKFEWNYKLYVPYEKFKSLKKSHCRAGDLIFPKIGNRTVGSCAIVTEIEGYKEFLLSTNMMKMSLKPELADIKYVYYYFCQPSIRQYIESIAGGGAQPIFNFTSLKNFDIDLPEISIQSKIAAILSAYDDLIENNTRRIKIQEEMAQALYREWFVNFRFPGHENVPMVDSPLGEIPEGWEAKRVSDAITINPKMKVPKEGEKPFIAMDNLSTNSMIIDGFNYKTGNSGSKFKNKDTLFARITPCLENGKTGFVQSLPANDAVAIGSTEFIVLRSKTIIPELVYLIARSEGFRDHAIKSMSGATGRQRVRENCFDNFLTAQPDNKILEKFQVIISPIFKNIHYLACKNANLRRTRDLLLPKLITGELDVDTLDIKTEGMTS